MPESRARVDRKPVRAEHVASQIRASIVAGEFEAGQRLPTVNELVKQYAAAKNTVVKAISILREEGRVQPFEGSGVYVLDPDDAALAEEVAGEGSSEILTEIMRRLDIFDERITSMEASLAEVRRANPPGRPATG
ncbi:winged helix-turn-helix domain-containing protein [Amycolatopsis sp. H20-H5]|uniref:winged helix-turn-helix domain-containing protein n=1 Tax=Amycolatopsis sp. H20-H5 TaxID=3046309 RepID=UPI002DB97099|nr:GntR family transcriptional regulator [Amycolatopsis sp. H20-H5]MEC3974867.1 GntR family transcriptional regulator [Amycolatopsis sp. H20-H5]